jgi:small conductance mechanosensitive channel
MNSISLESLLPALVSLTAALAMLWFVFWLATRALQQWFATRAEGGQPHALEHWGERLTRMLRRVTAFTSLVIAVIVMLYGVGIRGVPRLTWDDIGTSVHGSGLPLLFILGSALVLIRAAGIVTAGLPKALVPERLPYAERMDRRRRVETRGRLARWLFITIVLSITAVMILKNVGVDVTPLLAGGAIVTVALGFGAQALVRDIIAGIFMIVENQLRVGDIANINGKGRQVESVRLRTTALRELDGTVHVFQNGLIKDLSNLTMNFSYYVIDLGVAYKENVDHVMDLLREIGRDLYADPAYAHKVMEPLEVLGVDDFAASAVIIKLHIKTVPLEQWVVGRELRRRSKNRFDTEGVEIPFPHLSVYFGDADRAKAFRAAVGPAESEGVASNAAPPPPTS